jgi:hypothetical protein
LGTLQLFSWCSLRGCPQTMHRWRLPSTMRLESPFMRTPSPKNRGCWTCQLLPKRGPSEIRLSGTPADNTANESCGGPTKRNKSRASAVPIFVRSRSFYSEYGRWPPTEQNANHRNDGLTRSGGPEGRAVAHEDPKQVQIDPCEHQLPNDRKWFSCAHHRKEAQDRKHPEDQCQPAAQGSALG